MEQASLDHACRLVEVMRPADVLECDALGLTPLQVLAQSLGNSEVARALVIGGEVAAMWGVGPEPWNQETLAECPGVVWLLSGRMVDQYPLAFWRHCRPTVEHFLTLHPLLWNMVDARYKTAVRWLERLGFRIKDAEPYGPKGVPFHFAHIRRR